MPHLKADDVRQIMRSIKGDSEVDGDYEVAHGREDALMRRLLEEAGRRGNKAAQAFVESGHSDPRWMA